MAVVGVGRITRNANVEVLAPNAASAGGDQFAGGGDVWLYLANADAVATRQVTVATPGNVGGQAIFELDIVVPMAGIAVRGPFPPSLFGDPDGRVSLTYDDETQLTFGAWKLGQ
jgi:hypothetical protein